MLILIKESKTEIQNSPQKNATDVICHSVLNTEPEIVTEKCKPCWQHRRTGRCHSGNNRKWDIPIKHSEHSTVKQSPKTYRCKKRFQEKLISYNRLVKILIDTGAKVPVCGE